MLFIICSTQRIVVEPKFLIYLQDMVYRYGALLFFNALIPFSRSSSWNGDVSMDSVASCFGIFLYLWDVVLVSFTIEY